jgi:hypothetical protein
VVHTGAAIHRSHHETGNLVLYPEGAKQAVTASCRCCQAVSIQALVRLVLTLLDNTFERVNWPTCQYSAAEANE